MAAVAWSTVLAFLSPEWIEALDAAARADGALAQAAAEVDLVVEQRITAHRSTARPTDDPPTTASPRPDDSSDDPSDEIAHAGADAGGGSGEDVVYHLVLDRGQVAVRTGPAEAPTVRFTQDRATAWGIATGTISAQAAFMTGRLQVGGDLRSLLDDRLGTALQDVFATVRSTTTFDGSPTGSQATGDAPPATVAPVDPGASDGA